MADFRVDQAAGLRRLLGGSQLQVVTFVAGCEGVGRSVAVANLGVALARLGKEVLIIDENASRDDIQCRATGVIVISGLAAAHVRPATTFCGTCGKKTGATFAGAATNFA